MIRNGLQFHNGKEVQPAIDLSSRFRISVPSDENTKITALYRHSPPDTEGKSGWSGRPTSPPAPALSFATRHKALTILLRLKTPSLFSQPSSTSFPPLKTSPTALASSLLTMSEILSEKTSSDISNAATTQSNQLEVQLAAILTKLRTDASTITAEEARVLSENVTASDERAVRIISAVEYLAIANKVCTIRDLNKLRLLTVRC